MQRLGDVMRKDPNPTQAEAAVHVLDVALAWQRGDLSLDAVDDLCHGFERWQAMRFSDQTSEGYAALRSLVETLVAANPDVLRTNHGIVLGEELYDESVKRTTNGDGVRVLVWPMCWMDGMPYYPPVHLPHGEERRTIEKAMLARYDAYIKAKRKEREQRA